MKLTPDQISYWHWGSIDINATLVFTWLVMAAIAIVASSISRKLSSSTDLSDGQNLLEAIVEMVGQQIREVAQQPAEPFLPFVGTLFLFIAVSNVLAIVPGYYPPTASLYTTSALATCVFFAVPIYGIWQQGIGGYFKHYLEPTPLMLPFNIISDFSRTLALAVRLFGNMLSGQLIVGLLISLTPLFFPIVMQAFGLLTGLIQAYIFAILAIVYIASGMEISDRGER
jgi:F-type H+-transporting ATPase subunit a